MAYKTFVVSYSLGFSVTVKAPKYPSDKLICNALAKAGHVLPDVPSMFTSFSADLRDKTISPLSVQSYDVETHTSKEIYTYTVKEI